MKWLRGRVGLFLILLFVIFFGVWTFSVPIHDPGGRGIVSGRQAEDLIWSPDGQFVLYHGEGHGPWGAVHVVAADGSGSKLLCQDRSPAGWREEGMLPIVLLAHTPRPELDLGFESVDLGTGHMEPVGPRFRIGDRIFHCVSPSMQQAIVSEYDRTRGTVELLLLSPGGVVRKFRQFGWEQGVWDMRWSPDEASLALSTYDGGIETIEVSTGVKRTLLRCSQSQDLYILRDLAWSPDGREIAFSLYDVDIPGRALRWGAYLFRMGVTRHTVWMHEPEWFCSRWKGRHTRSVVYSLEVADCKVRELLRLPKGNTLRHIAWSPNGKQLAAVCYSASDSYRDTTIRVFAIPSAKEDDWRRAQDVISGFRSGD